MAMKAVTLKPCLTAFRSAHSGRTTARVLQSKTDVENIEGMSLDLPSGLCAVYKPIGWTSNDAVQKVKSILLGGANRIGNKKPKIKVGHGGTLDPLAAGVLVLGINDGTKLMASYLNGSKGYFAGGLLGEERDSQDSTGKVTETLDCGHVTREDLIAALPLFRGEIMQTPPMFSALKQNGEKLYDLARKGIVVDRIARPMSVYKLELASTAEDLPRFNLDIECSGGFYVRTLISDLSKQVKGVGHMTELIRTKQGIFTLDDCLHQDQWNFESIRQHILTCSVKANLDVSKLKKI